MKSVVLLIGGILILGFGLFIGIGNEPDNLPLSCLFFGISCPKPVYSGHVSEGWESVVDLWKQKFEKGQELGAGIAIEVGGKSVLDVALGYQDRNYVEQFRDDTLQIVFSSTKVVTSVVIAMLVDRGHLSYDKPISYYWPQFAQNGKADVLVSDLMSHAGGVPGASESLKLKDLLDDRRDPKNSKLGEILAATNLEERAYRQKGTQGYHGVSRGMYASQLCRRVDPKGRTIDEFAREEIVEPLKIDFRIGTFNSDSSVLNRIGPMNEISPRKAITGLLPLFYLPPSLSSLLYSNPLFTPSEVEGAKKMHTSDLWDSCFNNYFEEPVPLKGHIDTERWGKMESPSTNGITTAKSLCRIAAVLANGGTDPVSGTVLFGEETLKLASKPFEEMIDAVIGKNITYTLGGFGKLFKGSSIFPDGALPIPQMADDCVGWAGAGGSLFQWCPSIDFSFAYVMNYYSPKLSDSRGKEYMVEGYRIALREKERREKERK